MSKIIIPNNPISYNDWEILHADSLTRKWKKNWTHDSDGDIVNDARGMTVSTNKYIEVVWFKKKIPKDFLITFEWTSLKTGRSLTAIREPLGKLFNGLNACVLYLQARGIAPKPANVLLWSKERKDGIASHYQDHMTNVRISYSTPQSTVRFVQATGDRYLGQFEDEGIFTHQEPFYFEVQKINADILLRVTNMNTNTARTFKVVVDGLLPGKTGYFGFRQMDRRDVCYRNFRVYSLKKATD